MFDRKGCISCITRAARVVTASTEHLVFRTVRRLACKLAFGLRTQGRGFTFPGTFGFFTERGAVWFRSSAGSSADSWAAHSFASRASFHFAHFFWASYRTYRFFTVNFTLGALGLFTIHLAFGTCTNWVAFGRADWVVTKPFALRVAPHFSGENRRDECSES